MLLRLVSRTAYLTAMANVQPLFDWLVDGAPGASNPQEVIARLGAELGAAGVPVERFDAFVRTLHPHVVGRSFVWVPGQPVQVHENNWAYLRSHEFLANPVAEVFQTGCEVRHVLATSSFTPPSPHLDGLVQDGFTDYIALPLRFTSGDVHSVAYGTRAPRGFADDHISALRHVTRPLARIGEILALRRTATNLLDTYVGHGAGERILAGKIQRGDVETIQAVIWFSDLRGFTSMSGTLEPRAMLRMLNDLFDCQVAAIDQHGGEVLKFIGDGLLAIFPFRDGHGTAESCDAALAAATAAFAGLHPLNARRAKDGQPPIRFGLALHAGEVAYGNIGGSQRLDFTCIGPAVNLASRLETLSAELDLPVVASAEFAVLTTHAMKPLGAHELKGIIGPVAAFAPTRSFG